MFRLLFVYTVLASLLDFLRRRPLRYVYLVGYSQGEIRVLDRRAEHGGTPSA